MILQVLANAREVVHHRDIEAVEQFGRADAGALQHGWRADCAAAQQHFLAGLGLDAGVAVADHIGNANGAFTFKQDLVGQGVGDDFQGRTLLGRVQVAAGGTGATAVRRHGTVHRAETFLLIAVQVFGARVTGLYTGFNHGVEQHVVPGFGRGHADRTIATVVVVGADIAGFGFAEVRQAVQVRPVFEARVFRPAVVVHRVTADVAHAVDQGRTAQALAAATFHATVIHVWLWIGLERPVVATPLQRECQRRRHLRAEVETVVRAACFKQQHGDALVFSQTGRQGVTGRAGTNDDVIEFLGHKCTLFEVVAELVGASLLAIASARCN